MVIDTRGMPAHDCRGPLAAEACTELGADSPADDRVRQYRRLLAICTAAWLVPLLVMAVVVWVFA